MRDTLEYHARPIDPKPPRADGVLDEQGPVAPQELEMSRQYPSGEALSVELLSQVGPWQILCLDSRVEAGRVRLVFADTGDAGGPVWFRVHAPSGQVVVERLLRVLPTPHDASHPPITVPVNQVGQYLVEVCLVNQAGHAGPKLDPWELDTRERKAVCRSSPAGATAVLLAA